MKTIKQTKSQLREQCLQALLNSCREQVLQQIIAPFDLTPAVFDDKMGRNMTALHHSKKSVTDHERDRIKCEDLKQKTREKVDRKSRDKGLPKKRKALSPKKAGTQGAYTESKLTQDRHTHVEEIIAEKTIEMGASINLKGIATVSQSENFVVCGASVNQSMQDTSQREWGGKNRKKDQDKTNTESFTIDNGTFETRVKPAEKVVKIDILRAKIKKQGSQLAMTGAEEEGENALRQALGVLLYEFVNDAFIGLKRLILGSNDDSLIEQLIVAFKRVSARVTSKLKDVLQAALQGGVQRFINNFLTFMINSVMTMSAKVVTIIRESMRGLWSAIKLLVSPPKDQSVSDVCCQVTKMFTSIVSMGLGMLFEESIKGFITSIPILLPIADMIATAITGILTGVATALVIYGVDRLFDWFLSIGTERLQAQEVHMDEITNHLNSMATWIECQYNCSHQYQQIAAEYGLIGDNLCKSIGNISL